MDIKSDQKGLIGAGVDIRVSSRGATIDTKSLASKFSDTVEEALDQAQEGTVNPNTGKVRMFNINKELINNKAVYRTFPEELKKRITSTTIERTEDVTKCTIELDNTDNYLRFAVEEFKNEALKSDYQYIFMPGIHFLLRYSIGGEWSDWITLRSIGSFGFETLTITLHETFLFVMGAMTPIPKKPTGYTFKEFVERLKSQNGKRFDYQLSLVDNKGQETIKSLRAKNKEGKEEDIRLPLSKDGSINDLAYLQKTAFMYGFRVWIELQEFPDEYKAVLYIQPRDFWQEAQYVLLFKKKYDKSEFKQTGGSALPYGGQVLSISDDTSGIDERARTSFLTAKDIDPLTGNIVTVYSPDAERSFPGSKEALQKDAYKKPDRPFYDGYKMLHIYQGNYRSVRQQFSMFYQKNNFRSAELEKLERNLAIKIKKNRNVYNRRIQANLDVIKRLENKGASANSLKKYADAIASYRKKRDSSEKALIEKFSKNQSAYKSNFSAYASDIEHEAQKKILPDDLDEKHYAVYLAGDVFRKMEFTRRLDITVQPNVNFKPRRALNVQGTFLYDQKWYVTSMNLNISNSGISQTLNMISNRLFDDLTEENKDLFTQEQLVATVAKMNQETEFDILNRAGLKVPYNSNDRADNIKKGEQGDINKGSTAEVDYNINKAYTYIKKYKGNNEYEYTVNYHIGPDGRGEYKTFSVLASETDAFEEGLHSDGIGPYKVSTKRKKTNRTPARKKRTYKSAVKVEEKKEELDDAKIRIVVYDPQTNKLVVGMAYIGESKDEFLRRMRLLGRE